LRPLKVVIINFPGDKIDELEAVNNPEDMSMGTRKVAFSKEIYIEQDDFKIDPPKGFFRLFPGNEVRLRYGYFVKCVDVVKDPTTGEIKEVHCTYDPATRGGDSPDGRKVKGTIHWVSAKEAVEIKVNIYDHLFTKRDPEDVDEGKDYRANLNTASLEVLNKCFAEKAIATCESGSRFQFERLGYFYIDPKAQVPGQIIVSRIVPLRDTWSKLEKKTK